MSPHNLQSQMQVMAIMVRVEGYKAENAERVRLDMNGQFGLKDFDDAANEITEIMQNVSYESEG